MKKLLLIILLLALMFLYGCSAVTTATNSPVIAPPPIPQGLTATSGNGQIVLTWTQNANATSYNVYWSTTPTISKLTSNKISNILSNTTTVNGLTNGITYYFAFTVITLDGESGLSPTISAIPAVAGGFPQGLTTTPSNNSILLNWSPAAGATSYNIYWQNTPGVTTAAPNRINTVATTFTHSNLTYNTPYYYIVTAIINGSESIQSNEATATPIQIPPPAPTGLTVIPGNSLNTISWIGNASATSYNLYFGTAGTTYTKIANVASPYPHTGLANNTTYSYYVAAVSNGVESSPSLTSTGTPLGPVVGLTGTQTFTSTTFTWNAYPNATNYKLYQSLNPTPSASNSTIIASLVTTATASNLTPGATYYFTVTAVTAIGQETPIGNIVIITPFAQIAAPATPTAQNGNGQNTISWLPVASASGYNLYWNTLPNGTFNKIPNVTSPYTQTGLTNSTTIYYYVTAFDIHGESLPSPTVNATPLGPITGLTATASTTAVVLNWTPLAGVTGGYNIYQTTNASPSIANSIKLPVPTGTTYTSGGLIPGTVYYYFATGMIGTAETPPSAIASASPLAVIVPPPTPTGLNAVPNNGSIKLSWLGNASATSYNLYFSAGGVYTKIPAVTSPYLHLGLINGTTYSYYVTCLDVNTTESLPSASISAIPFAPPTAVNASAGVGQNQLSWLTAPGALSYNLYKSTNPAITTLTGTKIPLTNILTYADTGLVNGTTIYYILTSVNGASESIATPIASATPYALLPAPASLSAIPGNTINTISWNPVPGALSYTLYWTTTPGTSGTPILNASSPYTHTGLSNNVTYYYSVAAVDANATGNLSAAVSVTPFAPLPMPSGLTVVPQNAATLLNWNVITGASYYNIYYSTTPSIPVASKTVIATLNNTYNHLNLTNGITYYYNVAGVDMHGAGTPSLEASTTPLAVPVLSGTPKNTQAVLNWNTITGAAYYNIYRSNNPGILGPQIGASTTALTYTDTNLANGTTYYYSVAPFNSNNQSVQTSNQVALTPYMINSPVGITVIPASGSNQISWTPTTPPATFYTMYWGTTPTLSKLTSASIASVSSPYIQAGLTNGTQYYYAITATDISGESNLSAIGSGIPIAPPAGITVTSGYMNSTITVPTVTGATNYKIYYSNVPTVSPINSLGMLGPQPGTSFTHNALPSVWYYVATALNPSGESQPSPVASGSPYALSSLSIGLDHTLFLLSNGQIKGAGNNTTNQLGVISPLSTSTPIVIPINNALSVVAGNSNSFAAASTGASYTWYIWGQNLNGELASGNTLPFPAPAANNNLNAITQISTGLKHTLFLNANGTVWYSGNNTVNPAVSTLTQVTGLTQIIQIATNGNTDYALDTVGNIYAWGAGTSGEIGNNIASNSATPVIVLTNGAQIVAGASHAAALLKNGSVYSWGNNFYGQLALGDTVNRLIPTPIAGITSVMNISANGNYTYFQKFDGTIWVAGDGFFGELGLGNQLSQIIPTQNTGLMAINIIWLGHYGAAALNINNQLYLWGQNNIGQLGIGNALNQYSPVVNNNL